MKRIAAIGVVGLMIVLFCRSEVVAQGVRQSAALCVDVLLPSLFPFLTVALFAVQSGAGSVFSRLLSPVTHLVLRLPRACGEIVLFSLCGGYPTGARLLASAVSEGRISREHAGLLLCFCVAPGPAFVVLAVGGAMFGSVRLGRMLLGTQLLSSLLCGAVVCRRRGAPIAMRPASPLPIGRALTKAVSQAAGSMLTIFAWVILCGAILPFVSGRGTLQAAAAALLEVTNGCRLAASIGGARGAILAAFLLSFGGFGALCQAAAIAAEGEIPLRGIFPARAACGAVAAGLTALWLRLFPQTLAVWANADEPMLFSSPNRMIGAVCLCAMIGMALSNISIRETVAFRRRM